MKLWTIVRIIAAVIFIIICAQFCSAPLPLSCNPGTDCTGNSASAQTGG